MPRLLALHLNNVDSTHHRYGPRSTPGYAAVALSDANVGRVLRALDDAGVRDRTAVFLVADHGFIATPKALRPNAVLRREGLLSVKDGRIVAGRALAVPAGGTALVYLTDPATAARDRQAVIRLFRGAEGIADVIEPKDYTRYHLPQPAADPAMGDLVLAARPGYAFGLEATGEELVTADPNPEAGAHGFRSTEPRMNAIFVASGAGIKAGPRMPTIDDIDVAPTIARILGVRLENIPGRVLEGIFARSGSEVEGDGRIERQRATK
jgi:predicted AlkP superfamily pyrophosphatase or phosphodiesterase